MSFCKEEGKDRILFLTAEDLAEPSTFQLADDQDEAPGLYLPNGEINWNCPCLGGLGNGPCAYEFREAFTCFNSKKDDEKDQCMDKFQKMQDCFYKYPDVYPFAQDKDDDEEEDEKDKDSKDKPADTKPADKPAADSSPKKTGTTDTKKDKK